MSATEARQRSRPLLRNMTKRSDFTRRLPFEILAYIFTLVYELSTADDSWLAITWVNRFWREVALNTRELWTTLSFGHHHSLFDISDLLWRSGTRKGLGLSFDMTSFDSSETTSRLMQLFLAGPTDLHINRLRSLTIYTRQIFGLDSFFSCLVAPNLRSLTLEDINAGVPYQYSLARYLPRDLPALRELRVRGFIIIVHPSLLAKLQVLEISDTGKYLPYRRDPRVHGYLSAMLSPCANLEELTLRFPILAGSFGPGSQRPSFPALKSLVIQGKPRLPSAILSQFVIPLDTQVHLQLRMPQGDPEFFLHHDAPWGHSSMFQLKAKTAALALDTNGDYTLTGWKNPWARGSPAWSVMADMHEPLLVGNARQLSLAIAFRDLPRSFANSRIVHLELHINHDICTERDAWKNLLWGLSVLRVLRVGGERAVRTLLRSLPSPTSSQPSLLPPMLYELALCVHRLTDEVWMLVTNKVCQISVLRICLPSSAHADAQIRRQARLNKKRIRVSLTNRFGVQVRVEYGKMCGACHQPWDINESVYNKYDDMGGEDFGPAVHTHTPQGEARLNKEWTPLDNPDEWSSSSEESQGTESDSDLQDEDDSSSHGQECSVIEEEEKSLADGDTSDNDGDNGSQDEGNLNPSGCDSDNSDMSDDDLSVSDASDDSSEEESDYESGYADGSESDDESVDSVSVLRRGARLIKCPL
ncbi:hypothetical protein GY45DRAFT_1429827 [Cubamyces sp. BRFM 1775]|nr:hypothetical protein GY45DRAFT_1429827 [Cubamyces sp. BRFM 1775]